MKNLAGETKADLFILEELGNAGIEVVEGRRSKGEVPYSITGKLGDWNFIRAWYYWMAGAQKGKGLPLEAALELHNREYPIIEELRKGQSIEIKKGQPIKTYGQVIRVDGNAGCPTPTSMVRLYHVDTQEGLNALAGAIRNLYGMASSGTNPEEIKRLHDKVSALYLEWQTYQQEDGVEWLKKLPNIVYDDRRVTELAVGIKDGHEVVSIAKVWEDVQQKWGRRIAQYFFEAGQITGFNYGNMGGPGQILNRGPEIDTKLRPHYEELKTLRPDAAISLERCMRELEKPGPEYTGKPNGVAIEISLN